MLFLDALIRFSTFGLLLGLFVLTLRDQRKSLSGNLLGALCLSLMALMVSSTPGPLGLPDNVRLVSRLIEVPNTILVWLFVKSVMRDDFRLDVTHITLACVFCAGYCVMWLNHYLSLNIGGPWFPYIVNLYALALFGHMSFQIFKDRRGDLVEERRRIRLAFVFLTITVVCLLILSEILLFKSLGRDALSAAKNVAAFLMLLAGYLWLLQIRPGHVAFAESRIQDSIDSLSEQEKKIQSALSREMGQKRAWSEPRLTIKTLAARIGIGEHKLRNFINRRLGHRNFSHYLQIYRLEHARTMLGDPVKRDTSIITIARECGFNSSSTFNRVFKDAEDVSPKEYRKRVLSD